MVEYSQIQTQNRTQTTEGEMNKRIEVHIGGSYVDYYGNPITRGYIIIGAFATLWAYVSNGTGLQIFGTVTPARFYRSKPTGIWAELALA